MNVTGASPLVASALLLVARSYERSSLRNAHQYRCTQYDFVPSRGHPVDSSVGSALLLFRDCCLMYCRAGSTTHVQAQLVQMHVQVGGGTRCALACAKNKASLVHALVLQSIARLSFYHHSSYVCHSMFKLIHIQVLDTKTTILYFYLHLFRAIGKTNTVIRCCFF